MSTMDNRKKILAISAYYHDSAATLVIDGKIVAAAHEERFSRKKHDASFPKHAVAYVLSEYGLSVSDVDAVVFYDKPYLKFERLLETYHFFAPRGIKSFIFAIVVWIKEKLFTRSNIWKELELIENKKIQKKPVLLFCEHHLSHAASAFFPSPFKEAAILTIDGVGEWATATISYGEENKISIIKEMYFPHSLGLLYSAFTYYCGFKVNSGEYKLMGLAPYGIKGSKNVVTYKNLILKNMISLKSDGSVALNMEYFDFATKLRMCNDKKWVLLFGFPPRSPESELSQNYVDLSLAIQEITEESVFRMARLAKTLTNSENLVMAGGVALNCVANSYVVAQKLFNNIWIQPASGDAGGALGAALVGYYIWAGKDRVVDYQEGDGMNGSYLGPEFSDIDTLRVIRKYEAHFKKYENFEDLAKDVAGFIANGQVVGWMQGRMEWGPRALGNRSILADPRDPNMQKKLNLKIKQREGFRPFAPSVMIEEVSKYFETNKPSPYMLFTIPVVKNRRKVLTLGNKPLLERFYTPRSDIPSVTHLDYSARIHTVSKRTNEKYWKLINFFKEKTGYGIIINTSFNIRSEPIICTPNDAYRCFMSTGIDYLVIGNFVFDKKKQPNFPKKMFNLKINELD